jgi:hypothetical protein
MEDYHVERRFAPTALMFGNFVTGTAILAPAGMLGKFGGGVLMSRTALTKPRQAPALPK